MRIIQRDIVGAFIFSADDKLLLGKGGVYAGNWLVPGGGVEEGESKTAALKREIAEETGIDIADAVVEQIDGASSGSSEKTLRGTGERVQVEMAFYDFIVRLAKPAEEIELKTEDDFLEATWFPINKLNDITLSPPAVICLQKLGYLALPDAQ